MTRKDNKDLLGVVEDFEIHANDIVDKLNSMADALAGTPSCMLLAHKARTTANGCAGLCGALHGKANGLRSQLS